MESAGITYKRLRNHSMLCKPAQDMTTITHMAEKAVFFHIELGIRTDFPRCSPMCIQMTKTGIKTIDTDSNTMFVGSCMLDKLPVIVLSMFSILAH